MKSTSKENNYEPRPFLETETENSARKIYIYIYMLRWILPSVDFHVSSKWVYSKETFTC